MMKYDELRRLAIRLAKRLDDDGDGFCDECDEQDPPYGKTHTHNCPIAELEAEEAALKSPEVGDRYVVGGDGPCTNCTGIYTGGIEKRDDGSSAIVLEGDDWQSLSVDRVEGRTWVGWVRSVPTPEKPTGEFEGEY